MNVEVEGHADTLELVSDTPVTPYLTASLQVDKLYGALAKAQAKFQNLERDRTVEVRKKGTGEYLYSYSYTTLDKMLDHVRPILAAEGIALIQPTVDTPEGLGVVTRLAHESGQWIETTPLVMPSGSESQERGSALSYAKRYQIGSLLGIASEEDDDARAADGLHGRRSGSQEQEHATEPQRKAIEAAMKSRGIEKRKSFTNQVLGREVIPEYPLTKKEASKLLDLIGKNGDDGEIERVKLLVADDPEEG